MKTTLGIAMLLFCTVAVAAPQLYVAKPDGTQMTCSDEKITAELYDLLTREAHNSGITNQYIEQVYSEGNCSPIGVPFVVVQRIVLQVPAGPQNLVEIEIPNAANPGMQPETSWMMAADVEPATASSPTPGTP